MHGVRQRKRVAGVRSGLLGQPKVRLVLAGTAALAIIGSGAAYGTTTIFGENAVGQEYSTGLQVSSDQVLKPLGDRLTTPYGKFMGSTVSPDGRFLTATSNDRSVSLQVFDLSTYQLIWRAGTASGVNLRLSDNTVGQEGPAYSPDGAFLYMPNATGISRFPVQPDGTLAAPTKIAIPTPPAISRSPVQPAGTLAPPTKIAIPPVDGKQALTAGMAFSADGKTLYAAVNGQNSVVAIDPTTGLVTRTWKVGIAPRQVKL